MDKDNFVPQTGGGAHLKEGHEESDLNIRGIVTFGAILAIAGLLTFVGVRVLVSDVRYIGLEWWERKLNPSQLTAVEKQLQKEREGRKTPAAKEQSEEEAGRKPESDGRGNVEEHLTRTFPTPRLQYDDTHDMEIFRSSEEKLMDSTGKDAKGNVHIPVERAMDLLVEHGLPEVSGPFVPPTLPSAVPLVPAPAAQRNK